MSTVPSRFFWWGGAILAACLSSCALAQSSSAPAQSPVVISPTTPAPATTPDPADTLKSLRQSIDTGHAADALQRIANLRAKKNEMPGLSRIEGLAFYSESNLKLANAAFAAALTEDPNDIESAQMRGLTLFGLHHPAEAIPLLEFASSKGNLGKVDPNYILALCYMDTRRYDDARHAFATQFGFASDGAEAYLLTARMLLRREYVAVAQTYAEKAIELEPSLPLAHELLGEIALAGDHLDDAIAEFEKEKTHNPLEGSIYDRLGDAYSRASKYDDAQRSLQEAVLLEPNSTGPYILLGKIMLEKGSPIAAATYLERAEQMDPGNFMTHFFLSQAYRAMGRRDDGVREAAAAEKLQSTDDHKLQTVR